MIAVLLDNNIKASRAPGEAANTFKIRVANEDISRAVRVLQATGYPKDTYRSISEIFPGDGIIVTPYEQRARMSFALSQELSKTISEIDGVVSARVHVMLPEGDTRNSGKLISPNASVVVHHFGQGDPNELSQNIRLIVANAITNLPAKNITVSVLPARNLSDGGQPILTPKSSEPIEIKSPFGFVLWILAALALAAGLLMFSRRKQLQ